LAAVLEEMGASWTSVVTTPGSAGGPGEGKLSDVPQSRHVMGTVRMGERPATSLVDAYGRFHDLQNLVVADSSVFVTASGYGPTLTLAALAARAACEMSGRPSSPTAPPGG
jgi:choline dehydrogenase-like flavoprotein